MVTRALVVGITCQEVDFAAGGKRLVGRGGAGISSVVRKASDVKPFSNIKFLSYMLSSYSRGNC